MNWCIGGASLRAEQWLRNYLAIGDLPQITKEQFCLYEDPSFVRGFGWSTLAKAKQRLKVQTYRVNGIWFWSLPETHERWAAEWAEVEKRRAEIDKRIATDPASAAAYAAGLASGERADAERAIGAGAVEAIA